MSQAGHYATGITPPVPTAPGYGQVYNTSAQTINSGSLVTFDSNGPLINITHALGSTDVLIGRTGDWMIQFTIESLTDLQTVTLFKNGVAIPTIKYTYDAGVNGGCTGEGIVSLTSGDIITCGLTTLSGMPMILQFQAGFINASLTFELMVQGGGGTGGASNFVTNSGTATQSGGILNVLTSNSTVLFSGAGNTVTENFGVSNLILGSNGAITSGDRNTGIGNTVLTSVTSGNDNVAVGNAALTSVTSGSSNIAIGSHALDALVNGSNNTAVGDGALALATGFTNTALGFHSLLNLTTGNNNIAIGQSAGSALTTEANNLYIYNAGVVADGNTIRIGTQGAGAGQQNKCFIAGINGILVASPTTVVIDSVTGQLGVAAGGGSPIETITGNTGGAQTPSAGNFNIVTSNSTVKFAGTAATETLNLAGDSDANIVFGDTLASHTGGIGQRNNGIGVLALHAVTSGLGNNVLGLQALTKLTTGSVNIAIGDQTGNNLLTGSNNILISGSQGGSNYTGAESFNILIGSQGTLGESNTLRIGASASSGGDIQITRAFIFGIDGVNVGSVAKVVTESGNQLGTATITAGTNVSVTPGANTITIAALGGGAVAWSVISLNQTAAVNNGYFCNKAGTLALALPATSAVGDVIEVANENTALGVQFTQAAGQQILLPNNTSTTLGATGTLTSSAIGDTIKLVCKTANTSWRCVSMNGNWTPA